LLCDDEAHRVRRKRPKIKVQVGVANNQRHCRSLLLSASTYRLRSSRVNKTGPNTFLSHANSQAATTYTPHLPVPIQYHRYLHLAVSVSARLRSRWLLASCSSKHAPSISSAYSSFPHVGCTHLTLVPKPLPRRNKTLARELLLQCCSEVDVKQPVTS
jgi:hypothetical protein